MTRSRLRISLLGFMSSRYQKEFKNLASSGLMRTPISVRASSFGKYGAWGSMKCSQTKNGAPAFWLSQAIAWSTITSAEGNLRRESRVRTSLELTVWQYRKYSSSYKLRNTGTEWQ